MINVTQLRINGKAAVGLKVDLPDSPPLLMIIGQMGFVMCGFLNVDAAEKINVAAAMVSGVKTFDEVFEAEVKAATSRAQAKGVIPGMKGKEALRLFL